MEYLVDNKKYKYTRYYIHLKLILNYLDKKKQNNKNSNIKNQIG